MEDRKKREKSGPTQKTATAEKTTKDIANAFARVCLLPINSKTPFNELLSWQ
jgi:hypothetical protein